MFENEKPDPRLAGEPHSDALECACPVLSAFMRSWNDGLPNDETRTQLLRPLLPRLVGSRSTPAVEEQRAFMALDWLLRVHTPAWFDLSPGLREHAHRLRGLSPVVDIDSARAAIPTVEASWDAAEAAAWDAAEAAAWDAAGPAAWDAARDAAWAAARAAARDAAGAAANKLLAPTVLALQQSALDLFDRMLAVR